MFCCNRSRSVPGWVLAGVLGLSIGGTGPVSSADAPTTKNDAVGKNEKPPRLPNHFAKLDLSDEQKGKVQATQLKYSEEIDELKRRLKKLQSEQQKELEGFLTAEQRSRLKLLKSEFRKKPTTAPSAK